MPQNMNMYRWGSEALRRYSNGDIVVMAESVDAARVIALSSFERLMEEHFEWVVFNYREFDDSDEYNEKRRLLELDVGKEPTVVVGPLFLLGSE